MNLRQPSETPHHLTILLEIQSDEDAYTIDIVAVNNIGLDTLATLKHHGFTIQPVTPAKRGAPDVLVQGPATAHVVGGSGLRRGNHCRGACVASSFVVGARHVCSHSVRGLLSVATTRLCLDSGNGYAPVCRRPSRANPLWF